VQEAVLADMIEDVRAGRAGSELADRVVCVALWNTNDPRASGVQSDPSERLLGRLQAGRQRVRPGSSCVGAHGRLIDRTTGQAAVIVGVGTAEWVNRNFARVRGAWYVGPLYAVGSRYTVSFGAGKWSVDTAKSEWISSAEPQEGVACRRTACT
jgi:hypothetical protein